MKPPDAAQRNAYSYAYRDAVVRFFTSMHEATFRISGGQVQGTVLGLPVVRMTCVGRKTGSLRTVMLTSPILGEDRIVVVASNRGDPRCPGWFHNVVANPYVEVDTGSRTRVMRARVAEGAERAAMWPAIVAAAPVYGRYQDRADRTIPVVLLEAC